MDIDSPFISLVSVEVEEASADGLQVPDSFRFSGMGRKSVDYSATFVLLYRLWPWLP